MKRKLTFEVEDVPFKYYRLYYDIVFDDGIWERIVGFMVSRRSRECEFCGRRVRVGFWVMRYVVVYGCGDHAYVGVDYKDEDDYIDYYDPGVLINWACRNCEIGAARRCNMHWVVFSHA